MEVVATFTTNAAWNAIRGVDRLDLLRHLQAGAGFSDTCRSALGYPAVRRPAHRWCRRDKKPQWPATLGSAGGLPETAASLRREGDLQVRALTRLSERRGSVRQLSRPCHWHH